MYHAGSIAFKSISFANSDLNFFGSMVKPCEKGEYKVGKRRWVKEVKEKCVIWVSGMSDGCSAWFELEAQRQQNNDGREEGQKQDGG